MNNLKLSGFLLFLAGSFALMGIITAEVLYLSGYTTFKNEISPNIIVPFIGLSGTERWLVYPIVLWITGLGGYLMNMKTTKKLSNQ